MMTRCGPVTICKHACTSGHIRSSCRSPCGADDTGFKAGRDLLSGHSLAVTDQNLGVPDPKDQRLQPRAPGAQGQSKEQREEMGQSVCVCVCVHPHVYMYVCLCAPTCIYACACVHVHVHMHVYAHTCVCTCKCVCMHMHMCVYVHTHVCMCTYVCMSLCVYTCICVSVCACICVSVCTDSSNQAQVALGGSLSLPFLCPSPFLLAKSKVFSSSCLLLGLPVS